MPESSHTTEKDLASVRASYGSALRKQFAQRPEDREAEREHEFFLKRLRYRLRDMGVSAREIAELEKTAAAEGPELEVATLSHSRTAMLVIHGIGEQNPYETLDQFARNLTRYLKHEGGIDDLTLSAHKIDHNDWTEAMIRLQTQRHGPPIPDDPDSRSGEAEIDIYEYYWSPQTEDKISYKATISWLIKTTLTPIKLLSQNVAIMEDESDEGLTKPEILGRELRRIAWIYIPILLALVLFSPGFPTWAMSREPSKKSRRNGMATTPGCAPA